MWFRNNFKKIFKTLVDFSRVCVCVCLARIKFAIKFSFDDEEEKFQSILILIQIRLLPKKQLVFAPKAYTLNGENYDSN